MTGISYRHRSGESGNARERTEAARLKAIANDVARRILTSDGVDGEAMENRQVFPDLAYMTLEILLSANDDALEMAPVPAVPFIVVSTRAESPKPAAIAR